MKSKTTQRKRRIFSSLEKSKAVLSIWSERRTMTELCKELSVTSGQLSKWQHQAMEGMLSALESKRDQEQLPALNNRLARLLEKKISMRNGHLNRLEGRLETIQQNRNKED